MSLFNEEFRKSLELGKYSRWAVDINEDELVRILQAVDAYATAVNKAVQETGTNETSSLVSYHQKERVVQALDLLIQIRGGNTITYRMPSEWDQGFDTDKPVLKVATQEILRASPSTAWAESISERNLALLFWMVREFSSRNSLMFNRSDLMTNRILNGLAAINYVQREVSGSKSHKGTLMEKVRGGIEFSDGCITIAKGSN